MVHFLDFSGSQTHFVWRRNTGFSFSLSSLESLSLNHRERLSACATLTGLMLNLLSLHIHVFPSFSFRRVHSLSCSIKFNAAKDDSDNIVFNNPPNTDETVLNPSVYQEKHWGTRMNEGKAKDPVIEGRLECVI